MLPKQNVILGISLLCLGLLIAPLYDALAKYLSEDIHILEIIWARFFSHFIFLVPLVYFIKGKKLFFSSSSKHQIVRGTFIFLATAFFYGAISEIPLANALSIMLVAPIIVVFMSSYILKEQLNSFKIFCTFFGFFGTLLVIQPGFEEFNFYSLLALLSGFCYAMYLIYTRRVNFNSDPWVSLCYTAIPGAVIMTVCLPFFWESSPSIDQYLLMGSIGLVVILVHFIFIKAYQNAEASILAPFHYFEIISNMLISILFFRDIPNIIVCFGILCIVSSGVLITIKQKV